MFRVALPAGQYGGRFAGIFVSGLDIVPDDRLTQAFPSSSEQGPVKVKTVEGLMQTSRRAFLAGTGALVATATLVRRAEASLSRGLKLGELVAQSAHTVVATALDAHSEWVLIGGKRRIVTDTRIRIEETLAGKRPAESEMEVRVLGGIVDDLGERVDGQAELVLGEPAVAFLMPISPVLAYVTGAAQGHYRLLADTQKLLRLRPSPHLPLLLRPEESAAAVLTGTTLDQARVLVRGAFK